MLAKKGPFRKPFGMGLADRSHFGYTNGRRPTMRHVSLREFRTRGAKALSEVPRGETTLLVGQNGPAYFLVPVMGDVIKQDKDLRLAMARASMREGWQLAEKVGTMSDEEINAEIDAVRASHRLVAVA
jgi:antitoxin (DNA-binding transcriptional repressor) of toxin-antitoxin stability system